MLPRPTIVDAARAAVSRNRQSAVKAETRERGAQDFAMHSKTELAAAGIRLTFEHDCGMLANLVVDDGDSVAMLHRAPWRDAGIPMPPAADPHLGRLAGDYFCAPFGDAAQDRAPFHGWPANAGWTLVGSRREGPVSRAQFVLERLAMGATVVKELTLIDAHPFLYQRHVLVGGSGSMPVANHAMVALPSGGRISLSPKRWFETPATALETDPASGRAALAYPARAEDPKTFPAAGGATIDLTRFPFAERTEDFVAAIEADGRDLGWTAVARPTERDLFLSLRNPRQLPLTMLWHSNGGRDYPPWNGRHRGVLGIEEGVGRFMLGDSNRRTPHPFDAAGIPTALTLNPAAVVEVRHIIGMLSWSSDPVIAAIGPAADGADMLAIRAADGSERRVPCDLGFLRSA